MALKDKLMTLEDFKAVRDVDVASNSAQFTEIKAGLNTFVNFDGMGHIIAGWEYGDGISNKQYRIRANNIVFRNDVTLYVDDGFRVFIYDEYGRAYGWHKKAFAVNKNWTYMFVIARITEDTSEIANIETFASKIWYKPKINSEIERMNAIDGAITNIEKKPISDLFDFVVGSLRTTDGLPQLNWDGDYTYRVCTPTEKIIPKTTFFIADGYEMFLYAFSGGSWTNSGYRTGTYTWVGGVPAKIIIKRITEDVSEIADISEFTGAVRYAYPLYEKFEEVDGKLENTKTTLEEFNDGLILDVESYTYIQQTATTWQRYSWISSLNGDALNIKYDGIVYDNVALTGQNFRMEFFSGENATGNSLGVKYVNYAENVDIAFEIPGGAKSVRLSVYLNTTATNNLSLTITGLQVREIYNKEGTAHASKLTSAIVGYENVPDYYKANDYLNTKAATIKELIKNSGGDYDAFFFVTDMHWEWNAHKSPALINWLSRKLNISKLVIGGDFYNCWNGVTTDGYDRFYNAFVGKKFAIPGNHEYIHVANNISAGGLSRGEIWYLFNGHHDDLIVGNAERCYFAYDNKSAKIRYIFLNVYDDDGSTSTTARVKFEEAQQNWYRDVALGQMPNGYTSVIVAHAIYSLSTPISLPSNTEPIITIADSYVANGGKVACILQGHSHKDRMIITSQGIPVFVVTCDKYVPWYNNGVPDLNVTRTPGTITEHAFEVVVIDKKNSVVSLVRIGAPALNGVDSDAGDPVEMRQRSF